MSTGMYESLLHEDEGGSLDFKRLQYPFSNATEEQKSELLKDILAFANAWRRSTAYILIGVREIKGSRSEPVGVTHHLEDAALQQFVNSKTQRPVDFSYRTTTLDSLPIGVIEIPVQQRPLYLKADYGFLKRGVVYVRRNSSTAEADPDEVARMGLFAASVSEVPLLDVQLGPADRGDPVGHQLSLSCLVLETRRGPPDIPWPATPSHHYGMAYDTNYRSKMLEYVYATNILRGFAICVINNSPVAARGVVVRVLVDGPSDVTLLAPKDYPDKPSLSLVGNIRTVHDTMLEVAARSRPVPRVRRLPESWEIEVTYGTVLPRSRSWSEGRVFIGAVEPQTVTLNAIVFGENIPDPAPITATLTLDPAKREMTAADVIPHIER